MGAHLILLGATAITFFAVGVVLTATLATTAISNVQQRMQKKVRRWQNEAVRLGYGNHPSKNENHHQPHVVHRVIPQPPPHSGGWEKPHPATTCVHGCQTAQD